jgi:hypothetical protein
MVQPVKLQRFAGTLSEYADSLESLSSSLRGMGYDVGSEGGDYCGWQSFPRMLRALEKVEAELHAGGVNRGTVVSFLKRNDAQVQKRGCGSIFAVLEGARK